MFEQVCVATDATVLADLIDGVVYYGSVSLEAGPGHVVLLCEALGYEALRDLIDSGHLRIQYSKTQFGIVTQKGIPQTHGVVGFSMAGSAEGRKIRGPVDEIEIRLQRAIPEAQAKAIASGIADRLVVKPDADIENLVIADIKSDEFRSAAIAAVINALVPNAVRPQSFKVPLFEMGPNSFVIPIDVDFSALNNEFHKTVDPRVASITTAYILSHLVSARRDLMLAAQSKGDMRLPPASSALINLRLNSVASRLDGGKRDITYFRDVQFEGKSFADAIRTGHRTPAELVEFVQSENSTRLKKWAAALAGDANLIVEYAREMDSKGLLDSMPAKLAKITLFTGLGAAVDVVAGTNGLATLSANWLLGAADEFVASQLKLGWRPNSWVDQGRAFLG